ncbi:MAG: histidinol-phosphate transaminase [Rubellimicrobium sp.]|nr:histidinol-phosphate transaminase [Rubellimicrobium sp.]
MTTRITPRAGIMEIAPYKGGEAHVPGKSSVIKLSSNENPLGTSDAAREAFARAVHDLHRYPSGDHAQLRQAIGEVHALDPARIVCGAGSDELIHLICQGFAGPKDEVIHTAHGFLMYAIAARAAGATPVCVPERERVVDVDAILRAVTRRTRIVFVANPANPTGTMLDEGEVRRLADGLPAQVLLVLDGAYAEYVEGHDGGAGLAGGRDNVVVTRTFSKIYGLGGLRIGWAYAPAIVVDVLNRIRDPFNLATVQLAVAEAAVRDQDWVRRCARENARWRDWLAQTLAGMGVPSDPSRANFILARFADEAEALACDDHLRREGIITRRVAGYGLPECLRITVGDEASCRRVAHEIGVFRGLR